MGLNKTCRNINRHITDLERLSNPYLNAQIKTVFNQLDDAGFDFGEYVHDRDLSTWYSGGVWGYEYDLSDLVAYIAQFAQENNISIPPADWVGWAGVCEDLEDRYIVRLAGYAEQNRIDSLREK